MGENEQKWKGELKGENEGGGGRKWGRIVERGSRNKPRRREESREWGEKGNQRGKYTFSTWGRNHSLVPRPHPVFRCFQYEKAGEGLVSFLT